MMKDYELTVNFVISYSYTIAAESRKEAMEKAHDFGCEDFCHDFNGCYIDPGDFACDVECD